MTFLAESDAHRRAMPLSRLLAGGMEFADIAALHASAEKGWSWFQTAEGLGDIDLERARNAAESGHLRSAREWWLAASACYRAAQAAIESDDDDKRRVYRKLVASFAEAASLQSPAYDYVRVVAEATSSRIWLMRPAGVTRPPVVIVVGGFDGWREEHEFASRYLLRRGIAVALMETPGQGETRLEDGYYLSADFTSAFTAVIDHLEADPRLGSKVGLWGNSFGGYLAAEGALHDPRVSALCVNGGTVRPAEILERFPRFITKVQAIFGITDPAEAREAIDDFVLTEQKLAELTAPLLMLHGTPDQVFLIDNARRLFDGAGTADKTFREWPDGEHCIYNHPHERNSTIADWFLERLGGGEGDNES